MPTAPADVSYLGSLYPIGTSGIVSVQHVQHLTATIPTNQSTFHFGCPEEKRIIVAKPVAPRDTIGYIIET